MVDTETITAKDLHSPSRCPFVSSMPTHSHESGRISITLDQPEAYAYAPGDEVPGRVEINVPERLELREVRIKLTGDIATHVRIPYSEFQSYETESHNLCNVVQRLYVRDDGTSEPCSTFSENFSLRFPESSTTRFKQRGAGNRLAGHTNTMRLALPPSWFFACSGGYATCLVRYRLVLEVKCNEVVLPGQPPPEHLPHLTTVPLLLRHRSSNKPITTTLPEHHVLPTEQWKSRKLRPVPHTTRQKIQHIVTMQDHLRTPRIRFVPTLLIPYTAIPGRPMALDLCVRYIRKHRAVDPLRPDLTIKFVDVLLERWCDVRNLSPGHTEKTRISEHCLAHGQVSLPVPANGTSVRIVNSFEISPDLAPTPTYTSGILRLYYFLSVKLNIHTPHGHTFKVSSKTPLMIPPPPWTSAEDEEQLPRYEAVEAGDGRKADGEASGDATLDGRLWVDGCAEPVVPV